MRSMKGTTMNLNATRFKALSLALLLAVLGPLSSTTWVRAEPAAPPVETVGIKNFVQYLKSLERATLIRANKRSEIMKFYTANVTRFPKLGRVEELNGPTLMTYTALAGLFCKVHADSALRSARLFEGTLKDSDLEDYIRHYAHLFLDRDPTAQEKSSLMALGAQFGESSTRSWFSKMFTSEPQQETSVNLKIVLSICTAYAATMEFISI